MLPLSNRRILVTRARGQASALAALLEARGAVPILLPAIEIAPPLSWCALDCSLSALRNFDWLLFTSANAVHAFVQRARTLKIALNPPRIAVIGPATARAVIESKLSQTVDLMPERFVAESLASALAPHASGASMLLVRAAEARDVLPEALTAAGANLTTAEAYRNVLPQDSLAALPRLLAADVERALDAITFTSASTAHNLVALLNAAQISLPRSIVLASIGPITSAAMRSVSLEPKVEADAATIESLVEALEAHFAR
jgi:uroporphyrinogen-III synthase